MPRRLRTVGDWIADRYEVFAVHAGGMGVVYVAHDHLAEPGRPTVALKTLRDEWLALDDWPARFAAECEIWVRLGSHPNVVRAHAVEELDGRPHIVLELVTGGDLRKRIGTPGLDLGQALRFGVQFCLGMEHAIRQGLRCHRDIKPGNLMIAGDGTLKITDFGLAVLRDELCAGPADDPPRGSDGSIPLAEIAPGAPPGPAEAAPPVTPDPGPDPEPGPEGASRITQTGSLLGTLPYMAPEQFRDSKAVDARADVYAFGVVLFEMLTAGLPFRGGTIARLDRAHTRYTPPSVVPAIPRRHAREAAAVDEIVQRCLRKDPADRFETMGDLRLALTRALRRVDPDSDPRG